MVMSFIWIILFDSQWFFVMQSAFTFEELALTNATLINSSLSVWSLQVLSIHSFQLLQLLPIVQNIYMHVSY